MPVERFIIEKVDILPNGKKVKSILIDSFDPEVMVGILFNRNLPPRERWLAGARLLNVGRASEKEVAPIMNEIAKMLDGKVQKLT